MKAVRLISCFAACFLLAVAASPSSAQRPAPNPVAAACGSTNANYTVKHSPGSSGPTQPPPGEALVYVIETMPDAPLVTKKVNIGLDGSWVGATDAQTHISFVVTKGTHHLCAVYQGRRGPHPPSKPQSRRRPHLLHPLSRHVPERLPRHRLLREGRRRRGPPSLAGQRRSNLNPQEIAV
jgi:hypothetical protein